MADIEVLLMATWIARMDDEREGALLTMVLECFHLVSLLRILRRLIPENRFLQPGEGGR